MRVPAAAEEPQPIGFDDPFDLGHTFPASVTVTRTSQDDFQSRQLVVHLDGSYVGTLLWGDSATWELAPGPHRLRVHNTLVWKTVDFVVAPGEQVFFEVVNRSGFGTLFMTIFFGVGPLYVTVQRM
jgi:hypothetical protein